MDQFLKDNYGKCHTLDFTEFPRFVPPFEKGKPCFFPSNELEGRKRHLTLMKGQKWYDYTAKLEFQTIEDWMRFCGIYKDQVRFGYNRFDGRNSSISLDELLQKINYEDLSSFMEKLSLNNHTLRENVLIRTTEKVQTYMQYMNSQ
jgi:hypothetical protein